MSTEILISFCLLFFQQLLIVKIQASEICLFYTANGSVDSTRCNDDCCSRVAMSIQGACCSSLSWSSLAIPFFIITGVCLIAICLIYCRPMLKMCLCGLKCPCSSRSRVSSPNSVPPNNNPVYVMNNDDLPDYETITKDAPPMKDITPPPYNFVAAHPTDYGIEARVPSAPPQYCSRRNSSATANPVAPVNS